MVEKEKVAVVKCTSYKNKEIKKALGQALSLIDFSFKKNLKVLLKPNILSPDTPEGAITTNPVILEELCKILKKHNAKIYIGDSSAHSTDKALKMSGMEKLAKKYGTLINFEKQKKFKKNIHCKINKIYLPKIIKEVDLIINLPKLKTHTLTKMTGAVKNLYGCIPGGTKANYHKALPKAKEFSKFLIQIHEAIKPQLNIMDGILGMEGNGPGATGKKKKTNLILASRNAIALDIIAAEIIGFKPKEIFTNKIGRKILKKEIEVLGKKNAKVNYKKPSTASTGVMLFLMNLFPKTKIAFNWEKCIRCKQCEKNCPVDAIKLSPYPICNNKKCINCYCCIEVCPKKAVFLKENPIKKAITWIIFKLKKV